MRKTDDPGTSPAASARAHVLEALRVSHSAARRAAAAARAPLEARPFSPPLPLEPFMVASESTPTPASSGQPEEVPGSAEAGGHAAGVLEGGVPEASKALADAVWTSLPQPLFVLHAC